MFDSIDFFVIFDLFMLLLIGMGPKIALVPFLDLTKTLDAETQRKIADTMVAPPSGRRCCWWCSAGS
jgi:multiple antibiotic resistance protein